MLLDYAMSVCVLLCITVCYYVFSELRRGADNLLVQAACCYIDQFEKAHSLMLQTVLECLEKNWKIDF